MCPVESFVCSTCITIYSTGPHHIADAGRKIGVGRGWCNTVDGFRGDADIVFEVLVGVGVSLVGLEVDGDQEFG